MEKFVVFLLLLSVHEYRERVHFYLKAVVVEYRSHIAAADSSSTRCYGSSIIEYESGSTNANVMAHGHGASRRN